MRDDTHLPFDLPSVARKKVTAAFDGGLISSDGGVVVLAQAERRLDLANKLSGVIADPRDPAQITHTIPDMLRARMFAIAAGYEDANDLDTLRVDPAFKLACGRLPDTGEDLCSQPIMSPLENLPSRLEIRHLLGVLVDIYCASYSKPPNAVTLDILAGVPMRQAAWGGTTPWTWSMGANSSRFSTPTRTSTASSPYTSMMSPPAGPC